MSKEKILIMYSQNVNLVFEKLLIKYLKNVKHVLENLIRYIQEMCIENNENW